MFQYLFLGDFFSRGLKTISFILDKVIYGLAKLAFLIFCYISEATLVDDGAFERITKTIYIILGIGMTFIIAYYLLNYIVDPDKINDKSNGVSTIIKDIIIALVILTVTPTLFSKLYAFQHTIITSGVISRIILGGSETENVGLSKVEDGANTIVASVFSAFVTPNTAISKGESSFDCPNDVNELPRSASGEDLSPSMESYCKAYIQANKTGDISAFYDIVRNESNYDYAPIISTAAGVAITFFMLSFCINLAKRVGKMAILQLLAPIPALLEIIPGKKGTRKTWFDTLVKTYLEVFIFQIVIFLIIFLMTLIPGVINRLFSNFSGTNILVKVFSLVLLIFGLLQFAKEAPKMVSDLLGLKDDGTISAALKRGVNMFGATVSGVGSGVTSGVQNMTKSIGYLKSGQVGKGIATGLLGTASGVLGGLGTGMYANRNGGLRGIRKGASQGAVGISQFQKKAGQFFDDPLGNIKSGGSDRLDSIRQWATGGSYEASNAELQSYSKYTGVFDSTKINTDNDERYNTLQNNYTSLLTAHGITSQDLDAKYKAWKTWQTGLGNTNVEFSDYLSSGNGLAYDYSSLSMDDVRNISNYNAAMASRKDDMKVDKRNNLIVALAQAKALVDKNPDIAKIALESGINLNTLTLDANSDRATTVQVYDQLKKLNDAVKARRTSVQAEIAAKEMAKNAKGDSSGNK